MTHPALRPLILALSLALLPAGAALAGSGLYLDSPTIPGASTDVGHEGQVDISDMNWGVSVVVNRRVGLPASAGKPQVRNLNWTQALDSSVVPLFGSVTQKVSSASFLAVKSASANHAPYLSLTAEQALISSLQFGANGNAIVVAASLNPAAVVLRYDAGALGGSGPVQTTRYDVLTNAVTGPSGRQPLAGPGTAPASAGLYMRLGSGATAIAGDGQLIGYENWIAIDSYSMGSTLILGAGGQVTGTPSVGELSWMQSLDATAPAVLSDLLQGQSIGQVTIEKVVLDRQGQPVTVMQQAMNDVLFSSVTLNASDADHVSLAGSMNFASFTQTLWPTQADGSRGAPVSFGFDVVNGVAIAGALADDVAGFGSGNLDPSAQPLPVPEPQTAVLLLAGIAGLLGVAHRRGAAGGVPARGACGRPA